MSQNRRLIPLALALLVILLCAGAAQADDNYVHTFTGFTFPPKVAGFTQMRVVPYNDEHSDIQVDYDNQPYTVHLSFYVYPAHDPLRQHYEKCKADVSTVHPDAKLLEEKPVTFNRSGATYEGFSALFSFRDKMIGNTPQDLLSQLIVFRRGNYYVLFRISYLKSDKDAAESQITTFLQQFVWPDGDGTSANPA